MKTDEIFTLQVTSTDKVCAAGETFGQMCRAQGKVPVFSCEGGCIKGEIARQAANLVAGDEGCARACHGELFSVPQSELAHWVKEAARVVVIDGCGIRCHGRIAENILGRDKLINVNALAIHRRYADLMDIGEVPEEERRKAAKEVADKVLTDLKSGIPCCPAELSSCGCNCSQPAATHAPAEALT